MCKFRPLNPDEVELRVAQYGKTKEGRVWAQYLIYKDARVDQRLLDETVGPLKWQKSYEIIDGKLYCTVSIWSEELGEWIGKQDVGTESNTEKEKGQASDAFKRACFNWGIGRELYSAPDIYITLAEGEYTIKGDKIYPKSGIFKVSVMDVDEAKRIITNLVITDRFGTVRFPSKPSANTAKPAQKPATQQDHRKHPTEGQLRNMAVRVANGENITEKIQLNFLMSQQEWMQLADLVKEIETHASNDSIQ